VNDEEESAIVQAHAKELGEHFDAVVILCSRHEGSKGTRTISKGSGNWHTQLGVVREYMLSNEEAIREEARKDAKKRR
jgi:hypothetical protein